MTRIMVAAALAALSVVPAFAAEVPIIDYVPRQTPPPSVPADMNVTCANKPEFTALAVNCPVIRYQA